MSIVKNIKKISNSDLTEIISLMTHVKTKSSKRPYNISNKNSFRNTLERMNNKSKKHHNSSKKKKNNSKDSEIFLKNYLSQRPRLNTEGNDNNNKKMKFSFDLFNNKINRFFPLPLRFSVRESTSLL